MENTVYFGDNLKLLKTLPDNSIDLIYIDPPFNTGKVQARKRFRTVRTQDGEGDRIGFGGNSYQTEVLGEGEYNDVFGDFEAFLRPRLKEAYRVLKPDGSFYFHIDYREAHYCKITLDQIFGRENFINEIIWAYDFGGRAKDRWPAKHDTIFFYAKDDQNYTFNLDDIDRIPYMAPGLVGPEKAAKGKLPTDTWWHTIVGTNSREKTGYPTQKPVGILERIVRASSDPGDLVLDFFAGSGTTGQACLNLGRKFILCDSNPQAIEVMKIRFAEYTDIEWKQL
jgi:site-specific DNA-methyltransferase (adenine-specific)